MSDEKQQKKSTGGGGGDDDDLQTASLRRPPMETAPIAAVVRVVSSSSSYRLERGVCVIGTAPEADLVLTSGAVSRKHLELELVPEGVRLTDLGSRNGTFYMGQRIERAIVSLGAHIVVGDIEIAIDADAPDAVELEPLAETEYRGMLGRSLSMRRLFALLARLEGSLVNVLVIGESGVGKELVARAIHEGSRVADGPFVALNCGALPRELVASELFGHVKGAFTGAANTRRLGAFESANGGTLFLDEIGELPRDMQPLLLRVLEAGEVRPLGSDEVKRVTVRVVCATNRPLEEDVAAGLFRQDLYFRLAVVRALVPPLRSRREDIELLAQRFATHNDEAGVTIPAAEMERIRGRSFFGNARELRNLVSAFAVLGRFPDEVSLRAPNQAPPPRIDEVLAAEVDADRAYAEQKDRLVDLFTRQYLIAVMDRCGQNQSAAAKIAGLNRSYLGELLAKHGLLKTR